MFTDGITGGDPEYFFKAILDSNNSINKTTVRDNENWLSVTLPEHEPSLCPIYAWDGNK